VRFCHLLGERGHQDALIVLGAFADLLDQVVDLSLRRPDLHLGIDQPGGPDDLLDDPLGQPQLVVAWRRGHEHDLVHASGELVEPQGSVVDGARQAEPVLDERRLPGQVSLVHPVELRDGDVRLVDHDQVVVGEVVEERVRRRARAAAVDVARVVLDAAAETDLAHHLEVVRRAHAEPFGFEQLALIVQLSEPLMELLLDGPERALHPFVAGHVVGGGEDGGLGELAHDLAGERVELRDPLDGVAPPLDPRPDLLVRREHLERVAGHAERAAARLTWLRWYWMSTSCCIANSSGISVPL
jgi:hypothetical protein